MASIARINSNSERYFAALAVAERRALHSFFDQHIVEDRELGYFALVTTTRFLRILQRAWCIRFMGQCSMSSDRRIRAGTGNGSCLFSCSQG